MSSRPSGWAAIALLSACAVSSSGQGGVEASDGGTSAGDGAVTVVGACAAGFVRCGRLCVDAALVGAGCTAPTCAVGLGAAAPPATLGPRGFAQRLDFDGTTARVEVVTGAADGALTGTVGVDLNLRRADGAVATLAMAPSGNRTFGASFVGRPGEPVDYYLTQRFGPNTFHPASPGGHPTADSAWFRRTLGAPPPAPPAYPLTTRVGARFRDRHRNEWRYDHYVGSYAAGTALTLTLVDRGDRLDLTVVPDPRAAVGKIDLKWYEVFGPTPFCGDPPALAGLAAPGAGMRKSGNSFTYTIDRVVEGQQVDFELTLTELQGPVLTYYSEWFYYRVGTGTLGRRDQHPWAYAAGGAAVSDVSVHQFALAQHVPTASPETLTEFLAGKLFFDTDFATGLLANPPTTWDCRGTQPIGVAPVPSPAAAPHRAALGPDHDAASCAGCHPLDGRGLPPEGRDEPSTVVLIAGAPDSAYGTQVTRRHTTGAAEAQLAVAWEEVPGRYDDGGTFTLRRPRWRLDALGRGPLDAGRISVRVAPPIAGGGLLDAVPAASLASLADPDDADGDGISGRPGPGRFGWKATQPTLAAQVAAAFANDMGMTPAELPVARLDETVAYVRALSVPPRLNHRDPGAVRGQALFDRAGCAGCHVPNLVTGSEAEPPELAGQVIQPFSDLLLHDLGDGLADPGPDGREWRTTPLWGLAYADAPLEPATDPRTPNRTSGRARYLHDGRARTIAEAILWHGGEAEAARRAFVAMTADERDDLLAFVRYPFADPLPVGCP